MEVLHIDPNELVPPPPETPQLDTVAVIYTGGTIGMCKNSEGHFSADCEENKDMNTAFLIETMKKVSLFHHKDLPKYHILSCKPLLDSANMNISDWFRIAKIVYSLYDQYKAFVIIHGTDTMAWTASILSFILINLHKPVIITGAQLPCSEAYSDGYFNLIGALRATTFGINEVMVFFDHKLLRGNRVQKYSAWSMNAFDSASLEPLALQGTDLKFNRHITDAYKPVWLKTNDEEFQIVRPCDKIAMIGLYPGFHCEILKTFRNMRGLVLQAFGTGNGPSTDEFLNGLKDLHDNGVVIVVVTSTYTGNVNLGAYEAASALRNSGCISGYCMTPEAAFCKLSYLCGLNLTQTEVEREFNMPLRGEFDPVSE